MATADQGDMTVVVPKLSQAERIINTFVAPTKTFNDVRRSASWWAPWLLMAVCSVAMVMTVSQKVGFEQVNENNLRMRPKQLEQLEKAPPDQQARQRSIGVAVTKGISYGFPLASLIFLAIVALILWATANFGAGAETTFGAVMAVVMYASLPGCIKALLTVVTLLAGVSPEGFTFQNPIASNLSFLAPTPGALNAALTALDVFQLWTLWLTVIGLTCIGKLKRGTAIGIVFGWWGFVTLLGVGVAAMFS